jgi:hypothetical protein
MARRGQEQKRPSFRITTMDKSSRPTLMLMLTDDSLGGRVMVGLESFLEFSDEMNRALVQFDIENEGRRRPARAGKLWWHRPRDFGRALGR